MSKLVVSKLFKPSNGVPRPALLLSGGIFVLSICSFMIVPLLALYLSAQLHSPAGQIGIVLAVMAIANQGLQFLVGMVASRVGSRKVLTVGIFVACAGYGGFALGPPFALQLLCALSLGLGRAIISLVGKVMLAEEAGDKQASALTLRSVAVNAGAAIGPAAGGVLFGKFSIALWAVVVVHVLFWLSLRRISPAVGSGAQARPPEGQDVQRHAIGQQLRALLRNWPLVGITCASVGFWYLYTQLTFTFPLYANDKFHLGGRVGLLFTINAILAVALQYAAVTWLIRRAGGWRVLSGGCVTLAGAFLVLGIFPARWALVLFVIVFSLGELAIVPTLDIVTAEVSGPATLAGSFGFASLGWAAGGVLGSLIGGAAFQYAREVGQFGLFWVFNCLLGVAAGAAFAIMRWRSARDRNPAAKGTAVQEEAAQTT